MDTRTDYYAVLGVLPHAEDVVIRAAYKALVQRFHPDRNSGSTDEANRRTAEINVAYSVLSHPAKRREYDEQRGPSVQAGDGYFSDAAADEAPPGYDPLKSDWDFACTYYPDLKQVEARLAMISWRLAYSFRAQLLETKAFERRTEVAGAIERQFLEEYFGTNAQIIQFARALIERRRKSAARALNRAVSVLGSSVPPNMIIDRISRCFNLVGVLDPPEGVPVPIWREQVMRTHGVIMVGDSYRWRDRQYGSFQDVLNAIRLDGHA